MKHAKDSDNMAIVGSFYALQQWKKYIYTLIHKNSSSSMNRHLFELDKGRNISMFKKDYVKFTKTYIWNILNNISKVTIIRKVLDTQLTLILGNYKVTTQWALEQRYTVIICKNRLNIAPVHKLVCGFSLFNMKPD